MGSHRQGGLFSQLNISQNLKKKVKSEIFPPNYLLSADSHLQYPVLLEYLQGETDGGISDCWGSSHIPLTFTSPILASWDSLPEDIFYWSTFGPFAGQAWSVGELVLLEAVLNQWWIGNW